MSYRPQNGIPVTNVAGMPMAVGFNPALVGQPMMMNIGQPMMMRQTMMPSMIVANPSINPAAVQASRAAAAQQAHNMQNGIVQQQMPQEPQVGPSVTVFVGNISEKATDTLVRQILMKCGTVNNWKRVQGASGKLQAFGFCEFKEPDSALRALRLLQGYRLGDKELLVNVDSNAQHIIDQWKHRSGIVRDSDGMDVLNQTVKQKDEAVRVELKALLRDYATDLYVEEEDEKPEKKSEPGPVVISAEPTKAGDGTKKESKESEEKKKPEIVNVDLTTAKDKRESESRDEKRSSSTNRRTQPLDSSKRESSSNRRDRSRDRSRDDSRRRSRERGAGTDNRNAREPSRSNKSEERRRRRSEERRKDEDELLERRRLERKVREKDSAYHERLVGWEARERRRARDWERIETREAEHRRQMAKEARRLRDFLENYDDERDDRKFYFGSGSAFQRRLQNRDKEKDFDNKDRRKEEEEIGSLRRKLAAEGHPDPDEAISKVIKEAEEVWKPFIKPETRKKKHAGSTTESEESESEESSSDSDQAQSDDDEPIVNQIRKASNEQAATTNNQHTSDEDDNDGVAMDCADDYDMSGDVSRAPIRLPGLETKKTMDSGQNSPTIQPDKRRKVASVFREDDEEEVEKMTEVKRRKLAPTKEIKSAEERKTLVRALIERIPTDRGALFAYPISWEWLDQSVDLMDNRIIPWIKKKLTEIIGDEEPTLVEFVSTRLKSKTKPEYILQEIKVALEDEADMFVVKLWRLLIYETEARKEGITQ